jgi:hypothetical protein
MNSLCHLPHTSNASSNSGPQVDELQCTSCICGCREPFEQPRDSTTRNECAAFSQTKTTVEGRKKGVHLEYQNGFYEHLTKPRMKAI